MESDNEIVKPERSRLSMIFLMGILFVFLSACSPPLLDYHIVEKIGVSNDIVFIRASQGCNYCDSEALGHAYYASHDQGQNWVEVATPANEIVQMLEADQNEPSSGCLLRDVQTCYRIKDIKDVELSRDGGVSWEVDWQIPAGRIYFMQRRSIYLPPDTSLFDIQIIESNTGHSVIVAMGNQGVLVKSEDGAWNRISVGMANPVPFEAASFSEANEVLFYDELIPLILIAIGFFMVLSVAAWSSMYVNSDAALRRKILWACSPFSVSFAIFVCYLVAGFASIRYIIERVDGFQVLILILPLLGLVITWLAVTLLVLVRLRSGLLTFLATLGLSLLSYYCMLLPFQLWALGLIPVYEFARAIVWFVGIGAFFGGIIAEIKIAPLAVKQ